MQFDSISDLPHKITRDPPLCGRVGHRGSGGVWGLGVWGVGGIHFLGGGGVGGGGGRRAGGHLFFTLKVKNGAGSRFSGVGRRYFIIA